MKTLRDPLDSKSLEGNHQIPAFHVGLPIRAGGTWSCRASADPESTLKGGVSDPRLQLADAPRAEETRTERA